MIMTIMTIMMISVVIIYLKYRQHNYYTKTNLIYDGTEKYAAYLDLKNALFGKDDIILSNVCPSNFDNLIVRVLLYSKKAEVTYSENFSNVSDWFEYKQNSIKHLNDLEQKGLDFTDKIYYIYLIFWNLLCSLPKQREKRFFKQTNFFFEIIEFYNNRNCDVVIEMIGDNDLHQTISKLFRNQAQKFILIVKNRNEQFYRQYQDEQIHDIIKILFFNKENLTVKAAFWKKNQRYFEISVKFDSIEITKIHQVNK